ncbi:MAG: HD domain-containing protein [Candidatus Micrarchaeota archaeon]
MTYHHFKGNGLTRSEKIQLLVVEHILNSKVPEEKRESSVVWELKHSSGVIQMARILAQKREVDEELAVVAASLHDIHVIVNGDYESHAKKGAEIAKKLLESRDFEKNEIEKIYMAIHEHSNKHIYSNDKLVELIKDADCLDCFFYGDYIYNDKPKEILEHYNKRIKRIRNELGLPEKVEGEI